MYFGRWEDYLQDLELSIAHQMGGLGVDAQQGKNWASAGDIRYDASTGSRVPSSQQEGGGATSVQYLTPFPTMSPGSMSPTRGTTPTNVQFIPGQVSPGYPPVPAVQMPPVPTRTAPSSAPTKAQQIAKLQADWKTAYSKMAQASNKTGYENAILTIEASMKALGVLPPKRPPFPRELAARATTTPVKSMTPVKPVPKPQPKPVQPVETTEAYAQEALRQMEQERIEMAERAAADAAAAKAEMERRAQEAEARAIAQQKELDAIRSAQSDPWAGMFSLTRVSPVGSETQRTPSIPITPIYQTDPYEEYQQKSKEMEFHRQELQKIQAERQAQTVPLNSELFSSFSWKDIFSIPDEPEPQPVDPRDITHQKNMEVLRMLEEKNRQRKLDESRVQREIEEMRRTMQPPKIDFEPIVIQRSEPLSITPEQEAGFKRTEQHLQNVEDRLNAARAAEGMPPITHSGETPTWEDAGALVAGIKRTADALKREGVNMGIAIGSKLLQNRIEQSLYDARNSVSSGVSSMSNAFGKQGLFDFAAGVGDKAVSLNNWLQGIGGDIGKTINAPFQAVEEGSTSAINNAVAAVEKGIEAGVDKELNKITGDMDHWRSVASRPAPNPNASDQRELSNEDYKTDREVKRFANGIYDRSISGTLKEKAEGFMEKLFGESKNNIKESVQSDFMKNYFPKIAGARAEIMNPLSTPHERFQSFQKLVSAVDQAREGMKASAKQAVSSEVQKKTGLNVQFKSLPAAPAPMRRTEPERERTWYADTDVENL